MRGNERGYKYQGVVHPKFTEINFLWSPKAGTCSYLWQIGDSLQLECLEDVEKRTHNLQTAEGYLTPACLALTSPTRFTCLITAPAHATADQIMTAGACMLMMCILDGEPIC